MPGELDGLRAVIVGGAGGLGRAICTACAHAGAQVVAADLAEARPAAVAAAVGGEAIEVDVTDETSVAALFAQVGSTGPLDILVNCAGVGGPVAGVAEMTAAGWDTTFGVNLYGTLATMKHAMPLLRTTRGAIVNVASRAGQTGIPFQSAYSASKFAVVGLTIAAAQEVGPDGIRINAVCPGAVDTPLYRANARARAMRHGGTIGEDTARLAARAALRRLARPEDVSGAVVFLAGPHSACMTGQALFVDGGRF